jgi:hypothetical protein
MQNNLKYILGMKLNSLLYCFLCVFFAFGAFSQSKQTYPSTEVINKDTVIIFSLEQARKIAHINESNKECLLISNIQQKEIAAKDSIISIMKSTVINFEEINRRNKIIVESKDKQIEAYLDQQNSLERQIKTQSRNKWFAIIGGALSTGFMTYLYFVK